MDKKIVVIGLGNMLLSDEGFGVHVVSQLYKNYNFYPEVLIVDGGTQGPTLLTYVEEAEKMIIVDAVNFNEKPGTLITKHAEGIPAYFTLGKTSQHMSSFAEVLAMAEIKNALPSEITLIGLQPVSIEEGITLTPEAESKVESAIKLIIGQLTLWNVQITPHFQDRSLNFFG